MKSLIQKLQEDKQKVEIARAREEALQMEERLKYFLRLNQEVKQGLISEVENSFIVPGETMLIAYWDGKPVFGKRKQARGKIVDIQYNGKEQIVLRTGFLRRKKIYLDSVESAEYKPEIREAQEREEKKHKAKEDCMFRLANSFENINISYEHLLEMKTAERIIYKICRDNDWEYIQAFRRGMQTGSRYGDLRCAGAFDSRGNFVGGIKMYESMDECQEINPEIFTQHYRGTFYPTLSSIISIRNEDLRKFIGGFYAELYGDKLKNTKQ